MRACRRGMRTFRWRDGGGDDGGGGGGGERSIDGRRRTTRQATGTLEHARDDAIAQIPQTAARHVSGTAPKSKLEPHRPDRLGVARPELADEEEPDDRPLVLRRAGLTPVAARAPAAAPARAVGYAAPHGPLQTVRRAVRNVAAAAAAAAADTVGRIQTNVLVRAAAAAAAAAAVTPPECTHTTPAGAHSRRPPCL